MHASLPDTTPCFLSCLSTSARCLSTPGRSDAQHLCTAGLPELLAAQLQAPASLTDADAMLQCQAAVGCILCDHCHSKCMLTRLHYHVCLSQPNDCGPMYTSIGDGGNIEGLYKTFIDQQPQNACEWEVPCPPHPPA